VTSGARGPKVTAHSNQDDPPGEPYILHPMRVLLSLDERDFRDRAEFDLTRCVAILHDAVERGRLTMKQLRRAKLPAKVVGAVKLLTHDKRRDSYAAYVTRLSRDRFARAVKLADLTDNAALANVEIRPAKAKKDKNRVVRYALSHAFLDGELSKRDYRKLMLATE